MIPSCSPTTAPFELTGQFGGFVFTDAGKRRMLVRQDGHDRLLKVPRTLRRRIIGKFHVGESIRVAVTEERDWETGVTKQMVTRVLPTTGDLVDRPLPSADVPPAVSCVVRVCSKKNCWRNGGRELWEALERERLAGNHAANIEIRQVGCLDRCKQAPNADCGDRSYSRCSPRDAGAIIARAVGEPLRCGPERE